MLWNEVLLWRVFALLEAVTWILALLAPYLVLRRWTYRRLRRNKPPMGRKGMRLLMLCLGGILMTYMAHLADYFHKSSSYANPLWWEPGMEPNGIDGPYIMATLVLLGWLPMIGGYARWAFEVRRLEEQMRKEAESGESDEGSLQVG